MAVASEQQVQTNASRVFEWPHVPKTRLGISGAEPPLTDVENEFQQTLRKFALEVMRPLGREVDRLSPEDVIADGSPYWQHRKKFLELGIDLPTLFEMEPEVRSRLFCIIFEELGYGDAGLGIASGGAMLPQYMSLMFGNQYLFEKYPQELVGCWAITEPDHGSDMLDSNGGARHPEGKYGRPNCVANIHEDKVIINGQKSAWVSNATTADICILYTAADSGDGPDPERGCVLLVPMDNKGVQRGKPLDKLGQIGDPQGEVFFDNVEVTHDHILAGPDDYLRALYAIHSEANALMGATFTGVARSAFDLALDYAHERKQGGVPIIRHQHVAYRLFHMYRKIEASCALTRRAVHYNQTAEVPALQSAMAAKITATQTAFEVASDALQIFGGNGLTKEYPIEKILRDARASLIEDGCNEVLAIKGGAYLRDEDLL